MTRLIKHIVLVSVFPVLLSGCIRRWHYTTPDDPGMHVVPDYQTAIRHWGKQDEIHQRFISLADGYAVFLSWEVRQAFINTVRDKLYPEPDYLDQVVERNLRQFENTNEFYLGLYCYQREWCRLSGVDPVWKLTLHNDKGVVVRPDFVEEVDIPPAQAWLFPTEMTTGRTVFRIVFPKTDHDGESVIDRNTLYFVMTCRSLFGTLTFRWDLNPVP